MLPLHTSVCCQLSSWKSQMVVAVNWTVVGWKLTVPAMIDRREASHCTSLSATGDTCSVKQHELGWATISSSSSSQTFKVAWTVKTIARTTVLAEIMTRKRKCGSESNSFVAAAELTWAVSRTSCYLLTPVFTLFTQQFRIQVQRVQYATDSSLGGRSKARSALTTAACNEKEKKLARIE